MPTVCLRTALKNSAIIDIQMMVMKYQDGVVRTNGYLVGDQKSGKAFIIDAPVDTGGQMVLDAKKKGWKIEYLIHTHGHFDHIADDGYIKKYSGAVIVCHEQDQSFLKKPALVSMPLPFEVKPVKSDKFVKDGDEIAVGSMKLNIMHTPGHSQGSICIYEKDRKVIFTGDTLMRGTFGRTDFHGGSESMLRESLKRIACLPKDVKIYPGHGNETTIKDEKWLQEW